MDMEWIEREEGERKSNRERERKMERERDEGGRGGEREIETKGEVCTDSYWL